MSKSWSVYQSNVFDFVENGTGNGIVIAVAGSGKTTTIVESTKRSRGSTIFLAFNKAIADELKSRGVNARTFHSITFGPVCEAYGVRDVDFKKDIRVFREVALPLRKNHYGKFVMKLVGLGKQMGIGCMLPDTPDEWIKIVNHHQLELDDGCNLEDAVELASTVLEAHVKDYTLNFDDMLYMAVKLQITLPKFDFVFVDEAQDTNAIQRELLRKIMGPDSRMIAVGDPAQAIYGFRGSDNESLATIAKEFDAVELPLTISYRCPTSVVKYANQWVPRIEAAPDAPEGIVKDLGRDWDLTIFQPGDLVVCRTTRHIVGLGFQLIREQIPAHIMGKEIGEGLRSLIKKMETTDIDYLAERIKAWRDREMQKALRDEDTNKADQVGDKAEAILSIIDGMPEDMRSLDQVYAVIDYLFAPTANAITLATIHKSKGLEANRVFWLERKACPATWVKQPWQKQQELNLCYVAATRAKQELYFLEERRATRDNVHAIEAISTDAKSVEKWVGEAGIRPTGSMKPVLHSYSDEE